MRHTPERHADAADRTVKDIRRKTRKRYSSEDKIRIVLAGLRGELVQTLPDTLVHQGEAIRLPALVRFEICHIVAFHDWRLYCV